MRAVFCLLADERRLVAAHHGVRRKARERMMATTVASDMPLKLTVPIVRLAVETPMPMTMDVKSRFIGLL